MKNYLLALAFLLVFSDSFCQVPNQSSGQVITGSNISIFDNLNSSNLSLESNSGTLRYENIEGSPYIDNAVGANKNLPIGKFYTHEFEFMETALARYNAFTDNIEVSLLEDGVDYYLLIKKPNFLYIILGEKTYRAYEINGILGFFVLLSGDDKQHCVLLKKETIAFIKEEKASSSFVSGTPNSFKRMKDVYYFKLNNEFVEIPRKKKLFYSLFKEKNNIIKSYITSNNLKITKEEDLLKVANYYNSLLK
jgi:hypothetical protein